MTTVGQSAGLLGGETNGGLSVTECCVTLHRSVRKPVWPRVWVQLSNVVSIKPVFSFLKKRNEDEDWFVWAFSMDFIKNAVGHWFSLWTSLPLGPKPPLQQALHVGLSQGSLGLGNRHSGRFPFRRRAWQRTDQQAGLPQARGTQLLEYSDGKAHLTLWYHPKWSYWAESHPRQKAWGHFPKSFYLSPHMRIQKTR